MKDTITVIIKGGIGGNIFQIKHREVKCLYDHNVVISKRNVLIQGTVDKIRIDVSKREQLYVPLTLDEHFVIPKLKQSKKVINTGLAEFSPCWNLTENTVMTYWIMPGCEVRIDMFLKEDNLIDH